MEKFGFGQNCKKIYSLTFPLTFKSTSLIFWRLKDVGDMREVEGNEVNRLFHLDLHMYIYEIFPKNLF